MRLIRRRIPEIRFFYKILAIVDKLLHHSVSDLHLRGLVRSIPAMYQCNCGSISEVII